MKVPETPEQGKAERPLCYSLFETLERLVDLGILVLLIQQALLKAKRKIYYNLYSF